MIVGARAHDATGSRTDTAARALTGLTVAGLAGVAGAISFSHMTELTAEHGQAGWRAYAFPVSVDGLEIVASLFLVTQRRVGLRPGWLPWVTLGVGTVASLAANVAVGGHDLIGRALAGWPAVALLVSIKLLFSMFDHDKEARHTVRDDHWTDTDGPPALRTVPGTVSNELAPSGTTGGLRTDSPRPPAADRGPARGAALGVRDLADLIPAARAARAALTASGRALSRDVLADLMRDDGHGVSNSRASLLVKILKSEDE